MGHIQLRAAWLEGRWDVLAGQVFQEFTDDPAHYEGEPYVLAADVAAGDKIPRKSGPGVCQSDILVINKEDLAPYVKASLEVMDRDSRKMRDGKPFIFTNCMTGKNIEELTDMIIRDALFDFKPAEKTA